MLRGALIALSCSSVALGCAPASARPTSAPPSRVAYEAPADLLPAGLDAAFRVDMTRLASDLGGQLASELIVDLVEEAADDAAATWLVDAMRRSEVAWLGLRIEPDLRRAEKVLIAKGWFAGWPARAPAQFLWVEPTDGSAPHYWHEGARAGAFRRIRSLEDRLLILATSAEMDPLSRAPALIASRGELRPPERGTVSASARADELSQVYLRAFPKLAERFAGAEHIAGYVEPHAANLDLDLEITFTAVEQARGGGEILLALLERLGEQPCALGRAARTAQVEAFERSVRLRAELAEAVVQGLRACAFTGECCGRARAD